MTETKLDQINFTEGRPRLHSSPPDNNLGSHTVSDMPPDEAIQDVPPDEDEIEPVVLDQIQRQKIERYFDFQQYRVLKV